MPQTAALQTLLTSLLATVGNQTMVRITARKQADGTYTIYADHRWMYAGIAAKDVAHYKRKVRAEHAADAFRTYY
jgi:hypothetical protein